MLSSDMVSFFHPEDDVTKSLNVLNPKHISSTQRHNPQHIEDSVSRYESLIEYQRRITTRLELEKFVKDPLSLEERAICTLISTYKVFVSSAVRLQ